MKLNTYIKNFFVKTHISRPSGHEEAIKLWDFPVLVCCDSQMFDVNEWNLWVTYCNIHNKMWDICFIPWICCKIFKRFVISLSAHSESVWIFCDGIHEQLTHHGPVPHICVAIFSAYFRSAPDMWRWFQCSFPQCPIHGARQTARSSPVPQIVVARPHLLSHQRPIYVARHGPLSLHVLCVKY